MSSLKTFIVQFSHFFSGMVLVQLFGLITFPILTRTMTIEQYGIFSLINTTMMLSVVPSKAGLSNAIIRFYAEYDKSESDQTLFSSTLLYYSVIFAAAGTAIYLSGFWIINYYSQIQKEYVICFYIMSIYQFVRPINILGFNFLRVNNRTIFINVIGIITKIIATALGLLFLLVVIKRLYGFFIGTIVAECFVLLIVFNWFYKTYKIKLNCVSRKLIKNLIVFGFPLLLNEVSYILLSYGDRYIIGWKLGHEALGVYSVGYNLAMYVSNVISFALSYAVVPIYVGIFEKEGREKTEQFLDKSMHYLLVVLIPLCFGYYAISKELFVILASSKYQTAASFSGLILIGNILLGLNNILNAGLYLKKKSSSILSIMLASVIVNIGLNLVLISILGIYGAALATLLACILSTIITVLLSFPYIKVKVRIKSLSYYLLLSTAMYLFVQEINIANMAMALFVKLAIGGSIILLGIFLKEKEMRIRIIDRIKA